VVLSVHAQITTPGQRRVSAYDSLRLLAHAAGVAAGFVGLSAAIAVKPSFGFALVLAAITTSPWARLLAHRAAQALDLSLPTSQAETDDSCDGSGPVVLSDTVDAEAVRLLNNHDLCHAWRCSFVALEDAASPVERIRVVLLRQRYLDEMDRRDPDAFGAWLASGARAAGGPDRFLTDEPGTGRSDAA
jgi:hypothetical protein